MKRMQLITSLFICLSVIFSLTSCSNGDNTNLTPTVVQNNVQTGGWRITSYIDSGKDETSHFSGYTFTFQTNGTLTATNGSTTNSGSWSIGDNNPSDDSVDSLHFNIVFNLSNDFEKLSEDWNFISQSSNKIELIHVSGGNGGTDTLTFEKS
jgi:hypothetical protein